MKNKTNYKEALSIPIPVIAFKWTDTDVKYVG